MDNAEFSDLLDEQKSKIFAFLSEGDRQKTRLVCRNWRKIINEEFGIRIRIRNSTGDLVKTCANATTVELNSMTLPFKNEIAFATNVRNLKFCNIVVTYNVISFLQECPNIKHLSFVNVVVDAPMCEQWDKESNGLVSLTNLEHIEFQCWTFTDSVIEIMNFLKQNFSYGFLKEISVIAQNPPLLPLHNLFLDPPEEENHVLMEFVLMNIETLQKFSIGRTTNPTVFKFYPYRTFGEENPVQIKELTINPFFREEWAILLTNQQHLEVMDLGSVNLNRWENIQDAIIMNSPCLKSFSMKGLSFGQVWDCAVFQNCFSLEKLIVEICHSPKINLSMIPSQLKFLIIYGPLDVTEILAIAHNLVNLNYLKFSNLGRAASLVVDPNEKVNLETFKTVLQLPVLKTLWFFACSSVAVDWTAISAWCRINSGHGFNYDIHCYQMHGENIPDGITVTTTDSFEHDAIMRWRSPSPILTPSPEHDMSVAMSSMSLP